MAKDVFHNAVRIALQKEGWAITHDPFPIRFGGVEMYIDLGAEKLIAAQKDGAKIAVEVKSFVVNSAISEFHTAVGQFINYRLALEMEEPERTLYLAVPLEADRAFFGLPFTQLVIQRQQLSIIVYDSEAEEIVRWQP